MSTNQKNLLIALGSILFYIVAFWISSKFAIYVSGLFIVFPVITIAWIYGRNKGVAASVLLMIINAAWLILLSPGSSQTEAVNRIIIGGGIVVFIGWAAGSLEDYSKKIASIQNKYESLRLGIERSDDIFFTTDSEGTITYANPAFTKIYGYTPDEWRGKTPRILKSGRQSKSFYENLWRSLKSGQRLSYEVINKTKDGKLTTVYTSTNPILNDKGELIGFLAIQRDLSLSKSVQKDLERKSNELDIVKNKLELQQEALMNMLEDLSEEKELEESESDTLLETIGEGIVVTNEQGNIKYVNPAFSELTGFSDSEMINKTVAEKIKGFDMEGKEVPVYELSDAAMVTAKNQETKLKLETKDGKLISVVVNATPIKVRDQFKGVVRVYHDISEDVRLSQQKDDFFSIASHELRTPLSVIAGNLDTFLEYSKNQIDEEDRKLIVDTEVATDRLIKMVNDFLNISRLDQGRLKYDLVKVNLCDLTESVVNELKLLSDNKSIDLINLCTRDHPSDVGGDEGLLREILINLIGNSIKFTDKGSVKVQHEVIGNFLRTSVIDTGMGIDKEKQSLLFQRFQQAMSRTLAREAGGTGLGLYISREFARIMRGDLVLDKSEPGKGTIFSFSIPLYVNQKQETDTVKN
jgi:two-component system, sensor histidine kinase and response regulator